MKNFQPVLLGSDINVYGMACSFYDEYGVKSIAIGKGILPACKHSSLVHVEVVEPNLEDDQVFVKTLLDFKKRYPDTELLLVSCGDNYSKLLTKNQEALRDSYTFICNDYSLFETLCTKESFYETCEKYGLPYPKTLIASKENYKKLKVNLPYPVILKPSNSPMYWNAHFPNKKKVFLAQNEKELRAILKAVYHSSYTDHFILQEYIPGEDTNDRVVNAYCDHTGHVKMISLGKILLEECTPEGIGSYAAIISDSDEKLVPLITKFLEGIHYKGFANFDFKYDARTDTYQVFEINPRQGRSSYFVTCAGCNLAKYLVEDLINHKKLVKEVSTKKIVYTVIPNGVIRQYVKNSDLLKEANSLIKSGSCYHAYLGKGEHSLVRRVWYLVNQFNYYRKYKKYFGDKSYHGEI